MNVLGLDLSMTASGCVVLKDGHLEVKLLIKTKPTAEKTHVKELERLMSIVSKIEDILSEREIAMVAIEGLSFGSRNSSALIQLSGLNYMVRKLLYEYKIPFVIVAPTTLKKYITGKGNGPKDVIMMNIYKKYGVTLTDNNLADGYALARVAEALMNKDIKLTSFQKEVVALLKNN
jgi:crossover junction endodeoxyribonuclease RuvC